MSLFKTFKKFKKKIAITDDYNQNLSYQDLITAANDIGKKIKKRSLILVISENSIGSILAYIFCILKKHPVLIVDAKTPPKKIKNIINNYNPKFIFCSKINYKNLKRQFLNEYSFFDQHLLKNTNYKKTQIDKNLAILLSTSGSMGSTKFVKLSYQNLSCNTYSILNYLKLKSNDTAITNLPISYSYMLSIINTHLEIGGKILVSKLSVVQKEFWNIFNSQKITSFNGVPYTYEILKKIGLKNMNLKYLKYFTQAGGKLDLTILQELVKFSIKNKIKFIVMYGQTEASPRISYLDSKFANKKIGSIGKAIPGNKIYLVDENKNKIHKPYTNGQIVCEGKNIFMGYSKNLLDLKKKHFSNKLMTGDLGYFDKDNFFYLTGRINKIVKIFGNRIDLEFLENEMKKLKYDVFCLGKNDKIYIFYRKKYNKKILLLYAEKISKISLKYLEGIKLKSLPRTINKKISYKKLTEQINA